MKILIVVTMTNSFGKKGSYNSQEIGMAKSMAKYGQDVIVYKSVTNESDEKIEVINKHASVVYIKSRHLGSNGFIPTDRLDKQADVLIQFSDLQLSVPSIYKWCRKNKVKYVPYIGIIESTSTSIVRRVFVELLFKRNLTVYKRSYCLAKTNYVKDRLIASGVTHIKTAPVGIDFELLNNQFEKLAPEEAKKMFGFQPADRVALLVGRLEADRNPLDAIQVFRKIHEYDPSFRLLVVGKGELKETFFGELITNGLIDYTKYVDKVQYDQMWKVYRASEILISFSKTEIFGMSILEAMYYGVFSHVVNAPGPSDIMSVPGIGYVYRDCDDMRNLITSNLGENKLMIAAAKDRVIKDFSWNTFCRILFEMLNDVEMV